MSGKNETNKNKKKPEPQDDNVNIFGTHLRELSPKQVEFLSVFLESNTGVKAACFEKVGISRVAFHKWSKNEAFKKCFEIAEKVCEDARYEFCMNALYQMIIKGNDALVMGAIVKNAPIPAAAKIKALEIILKTTRVGKLALSTNIPEEQQIETAPKPTLSEIFQKFDYKAPHSRGIESIDKEESDEGE